MTGHEAMRTLVDGGYPILLLAGAGISIASGVPSASVVVQKLQKKRPDIDDLAKLDPTAPGVYAHAMELAFSGAEGLSERREFLDELLVHQVPSECHHRIAQLADRGVFRHVLTTNFDHLLEVAMFLNTQKEVYVHTFAETLSPEELVPGTLNLVKLHGDVFWEDLGNLEEEMTQRLDGPLATVLSTMFEDAALLVIGYACKDANVCRLLEAIAATEKGLSRGFFYVGYTRAEAQEKSLMRIVQMMNAKGKPAATISGKDICEGEKLPGHVFLRHLMDKRGIPYAEHPRFGLSDGELMALERFPIQPPRLNHIVAQVVSTQTSQSANNDQLATAMIQRLSKYDVVWYCDPDERRRKQTLACVSGRLAGRAVYLSDRFTALPSRHIVWERLHNFSAKLFGNHSRVVDPIQLGRVRGGAVIIWDDIEPDKLLPDNGYGSAITSLAYLTQGWSGSNRLQFAPSLILATSQQNIDSAWTRLLRSLEDELKECSGVRATTLHAPSPAPTNDAAAWQGILHRHNGGCEVLRALPQLRMPYRREDFDVLCGSQDIVENLINAGLLVRAGHRLLVIFNGGPGTPAEALAVARLANILKGKACATTPYDAYMLRDAYRLFLKSGDVANAWDAFECLLPSLRATPGSELPVILGEWWHNGRDGFQPLWQKLDHKRKLRLCLATAALRNTSARDPFCDALAECVQTLPALQKTLYEVSRCRNLEKLAVVAKELRTMGCLAEWEGVVMQMAETEKSQLAIRSTDGDPGSLKAATSRFEKNLRTYCKQFEEAGRHEKAFLLKDNLATLLLWQGKAKAAITLRRKLRSNWLMSRLREHRMKLFGNQLALALHDENVSLAETYFVLSGMVARMTGETEGYSINLHIIARSNVGEDVLRRVEVEMQRVVVMRPP